MRSIGPASSSKPEDVLGPELDRPDHRGGDVVHRAVRVLGLVRGAEDAPADPGEGHRARGNAGFRAGRSGGGAEALAGAAVSGEYGGEADGAHARAGGEAEPAGGVARVPGARRGG